MYEEYFSVSHEQWAEKCVFSFTGAFAHTNSHKTPETGIKGAQLLFCKTVQCLTGSPTDSVNILAEPLALP